MLGKLEQVEIGKLINICHVNLFKSTKCLDYLKSERGLTENIIKKYKIGYFPQNINTLTNFVSESILQKLNIIDYSGSSQFSDFFYLVFPIYSEYGNPVGIMGRTLLNSKERTNLGLSKYKNSSFKKANYLYGFDKARSGIFKKQNAYVVEGNFDHIALNSNGINNSVAICGTAFSKNHMLKLSRYTDKITFVLDRDDAGKKAMEKISNKYSNKGIKLRFLHLPKKYKDVDEFFSDYNNQQSFPKDLTKYIPNWQGLE